MLSILFFGIGSFFFFLAAILLTFCNLFRILG